MALATASIPIYIHLPGFAVSELGLSLAQVGTILLLIRIVDFVQDPLLGWMTDRWPGQLSRFAFLALATLAIGFVAVFSVTPPIAPSVWLTLGLLVTFTGYSLGAILLYGQSAAMAGSGDADAQFGLAGVREFGILAGVTLGAMAPALFGALSPSGSGYALFGWALAGLALVAALVARPLWRRPQIASMRLDLSGLRRSGAGWLLALALVNSLPVAVTSTLFVFFVEDRLALPDLAGPFLILFFVAAGVSAPGWSRLAARFGARRVLPVSMALAIVSFIGAYALPAGAALPFAVICVASGVALGADMVILSALFASTLSRAGLQAGQAFGFWNFCTKATLAIAAGVVLPLLQLRGFTPGAPNPPEALAALNLAYAILPCALKVLAIAMVLMLPRRVMDPDAFGTG
ncbi:sodium:galactoside symporter [Oceanicola sp. 22II-s10i]|nr:MFS transporter [Oceanicola sp. 22II-s10i]OWU83518.1 sodium:galactoside symporter [Oceanicola sp. 22II-s10i]